MADGQTTASTVLAAVAAEGTFQAVLDYLRHRIFVILAGRVAARLGRPVFEAAVETTLRHGAGPASGAIRDLGDIRTFIASGAIALPMDLLVAPLFLVVLFLLVIGCSAGAAQITEAVPSPERRRPGAPSADAGPRSTDARCLQQSPEQLGSLGRHRASHCPQPPLRGRR